MSFGLPLWERNTTGNPGPGIDVAKGHDVGRVDLLQSSKRVGMAKCCIANRIAQSDLSRSCSRDHASALNLWYSFFETSRRSSLNSTASA